MTPPDGAGRRRRSLPPVAAAGTAASGAVAALTATVASACCVGPVIAPAIVAALGAGGAAWAAGLKPYSPVLLAGSGLLVGSSFWVLYGRRGSACATADGGAADGGTASGTGRAARLWRYVLVGTVWISALIWALSLGISLWLSGGGR